MITKISLISLSHITQRQKVPKISNDEKTIVYDPSHMVPVKQSAGTGD